MSSTTLIADPNTISVDRFISEPESITLVVRTVQPTPCCPGCGHPSQSFHSHYTRTVADLPWHGVPVRLQLHARKCRCRNQLCPQKVFCERVSPVAVAYGRQTIRANESLTALAFALGGEAGARLSGRIGLLQISGDTLLRRIRLRSALSETAAPEIIGVDDWAKRRGQSYGTILVDLQRHALIELLPDREAESLAAWLKAHPAIQIISRDRGGRYADGAREGAPQAQQVADRWHLLKNMRELLERFLHRHHQILRQAIERIHRVPAGEESSSRDNGGDVAPTTCTQPAESVRSQHYYAEKMGLFNQVQTMKSHGLNINQIRLQIGRHHTTVARYFHADEFPQEVLRSRGKGKKQADEFEDYLRERWAEGCHNAWRLFIEVRERGYRGSAVTIRRYVHEWREPSPILVTTPPPKVPSPRRLTWLLLAPKERLEEDESQVVAELIKMSPAIKQAQELAQGFYRIIRNRKSESITQWMASARESQLMEFTNFVTSLRRDESAVRAALEYEWSNGQVEGQINRLKMIKRQMYGRAKFDLLRARVLHAA